MEAQVPAKEDYIHFFRLAETVLLDLLSKLSSEEIVSLVSNENWVAFPLPEEETKDEIENRSDPHIDLKLLQNTIRIGVRCNTVSSVDKLKNILQDYHTSDKAALVASMQALDGDFQTAVYAKIKEHSRFEPGEYQIKFQKQTNQLDAEGIDEMFRRSSEIREEGRRRLEEEHLGRNPVTPVIDIAFATVDKRNDQLFLSKLSQLKPIFETCLRVKTAASIRAEQRKSSPKKVNKLISRRATFSCPKCGKQFTEEEAKQKKFCDVDGMKIRTVFVYN